MNEDIYKQIARRVGSTSIQNVAISLETLIELGCFTENNSLEDLLNLCKDYQELELSRYLNSKLEQNYGGK